MIQALVKIGKSQYLVHTGQELLIDKCDPAPEKLTFKEVMLLVEDEKAQIGHPYLPGVTVSAKIIGDENGDKIRVSKYKAKSRYRKTVGFRPKYTKILIQDISGSAAAETVKQVKSPKSRAKIKSGENSH